MNKYLIIGLLLITIILYVYNIQYSPLHVPKFFLEDVLHLFKTGDMILFKGSNNFNSVFIGNYFTHIGLVYIDPYDSTQTPMLFEANGIENMPLKPRHPKNGIFLTPLKERLQKYKGNCFWKRLNKDLPVEKIQCFKEFLDYALINFQYDMAVVRNSLEKYFGYSRCDQLTNCGQIVFLSLIKLELIPADEYNMPILHHLKFMCNIKKLSNGYHYKDLLEIVDHPFAE